MLSDPIADMLTRIRNAVNGYKESVDIPASKFKEQLAGVLLAEGFVKTVERIKLENGFEIIRVGLKYGAKREQVIKSIKRVSRPGRRAYVSHENLPRIHRGLGIAVVSTSKGLMVDREARKMGIGGEVVCEVW
jgi:small subunit ribosomal protein S8